MSIGASGFIIVWILPEFFSWLVLVMVRGRSIPGDILSYTRGILRWLCLCGGIVVVVMVAVIGAAVAPAPFGRRGWFWDSVDFLLRLFWVS